MKTVSIDFSHVDSLDSFHDLMSQTFGLPEFYGRNFHALVDCLSSMRFPDEGMTSFFIKDDEILLLDCKYISSCEKDVLQDFLQAIENVNERQTLKERPILIYLLLSE